MHLSNGSAWFSCVNICRALDNNSSKNHINNKCKKFGKCENKCANKYWDSTQKYWNDMHTANVQLMIHGNRLEQFVTFILKRARKTKSVKLSLYRKFNMDMSREHIDVPIECSVLDVFIKACPFSVETQYRIGKYRLDAYIPRLKMGIQIDEGGHSGYNQEEEKIYDEIIRDHNIVCIRHVPDEVKPLESGLELIRQVWNRTLSPDFNTFSHQFKLG